MVSVDFPSKQTGENMSAKIKNILFFLHKVIPVSYNMNQENVMQKLL